MSLPLSEALDLKKQPASELGGEFTLSARKGERDDASAIAGARRPTPTTCPCSSTRASPHRPARLAPTSSKKGTGQVVGRRASAAVGEDGLPGNTKHNVRARARGGQAGRPVHHRRRP